MNQPAKFVVGIAIAAAAMAALMFISGAAPFKKRKNVSDEDVAEELNKKTPKPTAPPPENKPLLIQGVRDLLKGSSIDSFDGVSDAQFSKLSGPELKSLATAINSQKKYTSESKWRQTEPQQFNNLMTLWSKVTGRKISV